MTNLKVVQIGDEIALVLNQEVLDLLQVSPGDSVSVSESGTGGVVVSGEGADREQRLRHGKAFLNKYRPTFEALAK